MKTGEENRIIYIAVNRKITKKAGSIIKWNGGQKRPAFGSSLGKISKD